MGSTSGIDNRAVMRPSVMGMPATVVPLRLPYSRPQNRPPFSAATEGQTFIMVTSAASGGTTPAIACFIDLACLTFEKYVAQTVPKPRPDIQGAEEGSGFGVQGSARVHFDFCILQFDFAAFR